MKLGTKIILGFVLTNIIFFALVVAVFIFMRPVQQGAASLSENILPLLDQSVAIRYNSIYENFQMRTYMLYHTEEAWEEAGKSGGIILKTFQDVEAGLNKPGAEAVRTPEVLSVFQALREDYGRYAELASQVKGRQEAIIAARHDVMESRVQFLNVLNDFMKMQTESQRQEVFSQADPNDIMRRIERIAEIMEVRGYLNDMVVYVQEASADGDPTLYEEATKSVQKARELLNKLNADNRTAEARAYMEQLLNLLNTTDGLVAQLMRHNADSAAAAQTRNAMTISVGDGATKLRAVGNRLAMEAAANSTAAAGRVVKALIGGTGAAIIASIIMAFFITRSITKPINQVIAVLSEGSEEVDNASSQLSQSANTLAEGATENAASLEETSAALEELNSMTNRNADNAAEANALMAQANTAV